MKSSATDNAIGGYFELELPANPSHAHADAYRFQSARAAFLALLRQTSATRIWMPRFICDSMLEPPRAAGKQVYFYSVEDDFGIQDSLTPGPDDLILLVDYFGLCRSQIPALLEKFGAEQLIIDCSQAWYAEPLPVLATLYSARKFFGVPDGGFLHTGLSIAQPEPADNNGSLRRCTHLLKRLGGRPESGYGDYQAAECSLENQAPQQMSDLTQRLLLGADMDAARQQRNANFTRLHDRLGRLNKLRFNLATVDGPLCYPLLIPVEELRSFLIGQRIFTPTYWPEVLKRTGITAFEQRMVESCIALPCDQRYGLDQMTRMADLIESFISS